MATSTIAVNADTEEITMVNVFTVDPTRQTELVDALGRASSEIFVTAPGFISANLHTSIDGTRVVNYAQWASMAQYEAATQRPDVRAHMVAAAGIADSFDPTFLRVAAIHHR